MDLKALHSLLTDKKFYYFTGSTNTHNNDLFIDFSTGLNGRGDVIELRIGQTDNDINLYKSKKPINLPGVGFKKCSDAKVFQIIEEYYN